MFSLVVLVMCLFSHWFVLVMWPALFDISSPHVAYVLCRVLSLYLCWWVLVFVYAKSVHAMPCHADSLFVCILDIILFNKAALGFYNSPSVDSHYRILDPNHEPSSSFIAPSTWQLGHWGLCGRLLWTVTRWVSMTLLLRTFFVSD